MTREEAVNKLVRIRQLQGSKSEAHEALGMAIDALSQPSLPEGLEEASNDYARMETKDGSPYISIEAKAAFRAGAEWMAGQGVSLSHLIAWYIQHVDAHEPVWTEEHLEELVKDYILIHKN